MRNLALIGKATIIGLPLITSAAGAQEAAPPRVSSAPSNVQAISLMSSLMRQVAVCADRQKAPGRGASRITVKLNVKLGRDGSLMTSPTILSVSGVDEENARYQRRVEQLAATAISECAPFKGLPPDLYETPRGGWSNFTMNYKLPG
jgi:hypothetical protein